MLLEQVLIEKVIGRFKSNRLLRAVQKFVDMDFYKENLRNLLKKFDDLFSKNIDKDKSS